MINHFPAAWARRNLLGPGSAAALLWLCVTPLALAQSMGSREVPADIAPVQAKSRALASQTRLNYGTVPIGLQIALAPIGKDQAKDAKDGGKPRIPLQIGFPRSMPESHQGDLAARAEWTTLPNGARVTSLTLRSPGAARLRVALRAVLPEGGVVRFFGLGDEGESAYPVYTRENFASRGANRLDGPAEEPSGMLWSPIVDGDTLGIEIELPAGAEVADAHLGIVLASHIFEPTAQPTPDAGDTTPKNDSSCPFVDVACTNLSSCPTDAVARIRYTLPNGRSFLCSGTLLNTSRPPLDNDLAPYFLTAHHCISTQEVANNMELDFFYAHQTCDGTVLSSKHITVRSGAELLVTDPPTDMTLLELRSPPPGGSCLSGWSVGAAGSQSSDSEVVSVSHPDGRPQKYASGNPVGYGAGEVGEFFVDALVVNWSEGLTLGGSSGSGLFAFDDELEAWLLIGALSGGSKGEACPTMGAIVGRLDLFYFNEAQRYLRPDEPPFNDDWGGSFAAAAGILLNSETAGQIEHGADADMFRIVVTEPGTLVLTTTGATNTVGRLTDEAGTVIAADVVGGFTRNFRIAAHLEEGTYYVRVSGWDPSSVGAYRLHTSFTADSSQPAAEVPLFLAASHSSRQGFVRLLNASPDAGTVAITAFDDEGSRYGPVTLSIDGWETRHFNSDDLETGNASKGLTGQTGSGAGDWRLRFDTELPIEVGAYIRTSDGFLTPMHDAVYVYRFSGHHFVSIFNPGSNRDRLSKLRLINPDTARDVRVGIWGQDDAGARSAERVELTLPAGGSRTIDATQLEEGDPGFTGSFGDGRGKWRLWVEAEGDILVLNLLESVSGHLANLSSPGHIIK